jgi:hypothetical protein
MPDDQDQQTVHDQGATQVGESDQETSQAQATDESTGETTEDQGATQVGESDQQTSQDQVTDESAGETTDDQGASQQTTDDPKAAYENGPRDDGAYAGDTESAEVPAEDTAGIGQTSEDVTGTGDAVPTSGGDDKGGSGPGLSDLVKVGDFVYKIMQDSQPTVTIGAKSATVLPKGKTMEEIRGWQGPYKIGRTYVCKRPNAEAIYDGWMRTTIPLVISWSYGGSYQGAGRFVKDAEAYVGTGTDVAAFSNVDIDVVLKDPEWEDSSNGPVVKIPFRLSVKEKDKVSPWNITQNYEGYVKGNREARIDLA